MKIIRIVAAAGLALATLGTAGAADAQYRHHDRYDHGRHYGRGHGWNERGHAWGHRCAVEWRHHQRVRICR